MMLPFDPILTPLIVIGVFVYCACKGGGKKSHVDKNNEKEFYKWLAEGFDRRNHDKSHSNMRWVEEHFKD